MAIAIGICDDDTEQTGNLRRLLSEWSADKAFAVELYEYESAEEFLFDYADRPCDLLLLDIEMRGLNGMELARKLRSEGDMLPILFITGYSEYLEQGYEVEALHYLLKPLDREKLFGALDRYIRRHGTGKDEILVTSADKAMHLSVDEIVYVEADGRRTRVYLHDKSPVGLSVLECTMNLGQFEGIAGFIHSHRSYLVNLRYVRSIGRNSVFLDMGAEVPLSRRLYHEVNREFIAFYTKEQNR